jgi:ABC-type uncharacterized transport system ATPase subunit
MIENLSIGEIDTPEYLQDVQKLHKKIIKVKNGDLIDSKVLQEVKPELEKL